MQRPYLYVFYNVISRSISANRTFSISLYGICFLPHTLSFALNHALFLFLSPCNGTTFCIFLFIQHFLISIISLARNHVVFLLYTSTIFCIFLFIKHFLISILSLARNHIVLLLKLINCCPIGQQQSASGCQLIAAIVDCCKE